jgi:DNA replication protein DnaC
VNEKDALQRALEEAGKKRSPDHVARMKRGMSAADILGMAAPRWEGEYCPGCQLPLKSRPCWTCQDRAEKDAALLKRWKEQLGGEKAWQEYTEQRFVRTQYNHAAFLAAVDFSPRTNLLFHGPAGTGKSHLRAIACRRWVMRDVGVKTVFMQEELGQARAQMRVKDEVASRIAAMVKAPVLSIEDLGVEKPSEWVVNEWYYPILDGRYRAARKGLVVTMNHTFAQLEEYWARFDPHGRCVSRMKEIFRGGTHSLAGERDWRTA